MMWGYSFAWPAMVVMLLLMLVGIAVLVIFIWALVRWLDRRTRLPAPHDASPGADGPPALEVLQQRYARGEIDTATFENMRERLVAAGRREDYR